MGSEVTNVLLVSGPRGTGRNALVKQLMKEVVTTADGEADEFEPSSLRAALEEAEGLAPQPVAEPTVIEMRQPATTITRPLRSAEEGTGEFVNVGRMQFEEQARAGTFIYSDADPSAAGELAGLRISDVLDLGAMGKVCVIDADVSVADLVAATLDPRPDIKLTGVWVSLDSLDDIEGRLKEEAKSEDALKAGLQQVISDIEWGVLSGLFEFTIINDDPTQSLKEMRRAVAYAAK